MLTLLISIAGAAGAMTRFFVDGRVKESIERTFPFGTIFINVTGSFILGLLTGLFTHHLISSPAKTLIGTGFCGGYTTFSTANYESIRLAKGAKRLLALANTGITLVLTMAAAIVGIEIV